MCIFANKIIIMVFVRILKAEECTVIKYQVALNYLST